MIPARRVFGLAAVSVLTGCGLHACREDFESAEAPVLDGGVRDARRDVAPPPDADGGCLPEETNCPSRSRGSLCKSDQECEVAGSTGTHVCSVSYFAIGDLYGDPVCVSPCKRGTANTFADILCDGDNAQTSPGICDAPPGAAGTCLPACEFSSTKIDTPCQGSNKCRTAYFGTVQSGEAFTLGICWGACAQDADCKGTPGSKCQTELGICVDPPNHVTYPKSPGAACTTLAECNCLAANGADAGTAPGYCSLACVTGAAGDARCGAAVAGWKCSAALPTEFTNPTKPAFTGQPDGILGTCRKPCTVDTDCDALGATIGVALTCAATAGFKTCAAP